MIVVGVVSFGFGCATRNTPGYYARVNQVLPWINDVIKNSNACPPIKVSTKGFERNSSRDSSITSSAPTTWSSVSDKVLVNFLKRSYIPFSIYIIIMYIPCLAFVTTDLYIASLQDSVLNE